MRPKGVLVVPSTARPAGPWLDATRATSLQRVANRPIVCHALEALSEAGVAEAAIVTPPDLAEEMAACIESEGPAGIDVQHLSYEHGGQLAGALFAASDLIGDAPVILQRADGLLGQPLRPFIELFQAESPELVLLVQEGSNNGDRLRPATQHLIGVTDLDAKSGTRCVAGMCLLSSTATRRVARGDATGERLDFASVAEQVGENGAQVLVGITHHWRHFDGEMLDLLEMNRAALASLEPARVMPENGDNRFEGPVSIHPTATVVSSVLVGPVIVGAEAVIMDSYIGPHTSIGERVRVEGAEVERSIILAGASILHVGGRLVASVVGREARIFRDFGVPRALRLEVGDGDKVALC
jgi:glucose-1-phosphate thymidylyltransferase